jgi:Mor family transcriptional regulator
MPRAEQDYIPAQYRWLLEEPRERVMAELPRQVQELVELVGLELAVRILVRFRGQSIYIPQCEWTFKQLRNDRIRREFTGANHAELARRYSLTVSRLYEILGRRESHTQIDMFEGLERR